MLDGYGDVPPALGFCQPPKVADNDIFDVTLGEINAPSCDNDTVPDNPK